MEVIRKHINKSDDYIKAHAIVADFVIGQYTTFEPENIKAFRKYLSELSSHNSKQFTTKREGKLSPYIRIIRIK